MASAASFPLRVKSPGRRTLPHRGRRIVFTTLIGLAGGGFALVAVSAMALGLLRHFAITLNAETSVRAAANMFADASNWQVASAPSSAGHKAQLAIIASLPPPRRIPEPARRPAPTQEIAQVASTETPRETLKATPREAPRAVPQVTQPPIVRTIAPATVRPPAQEPAVTLAFAPPEPSTRGVNITGAVKSTYTLTSANPVADRPPVARLEVPPMFLPKPRPQQLAALTPPEIPATKPAHPPRTAIYDITTKTVYLPNGVRLEAHSGYGPFMDDPNNVHRKNRGSTPPNIYRLTLREKLFHGVQAIRMTPENEAEMFGRDGILAHSYLLGPSGQSHGCVSFKDYPRFLQAYLNGEIDRMVVVARSNDLPTAIAKLSTMPPVATRVERRPVVSARVERRPAAAVRPDILLSHAVF